MNTTTVAVPVWLTQAGVWAKHNWTLALSVLIVGIIGSIVTELVKRHVITTSEKDKVKRLVTWFYVVLTTLFSWLAYAIFFLQTNLSFIQTLPVVGEHALYALGIGYTLYNLRLNGYYKAFATWATKETKIKTTVADLPDLAPPETTQVASESNFEA